MPEPGRAIAQPCGKAGAARRRADEIRDGFAALQDDDDDEEVHDQHHQPQHGQITAAVQAEQKRHVGKGDARHADSENAPRPNLDIGRGFSAHAEQTEWSGQRAHHADQPARERVGVDHGKDDEPRGDEIAELGAEQRRGDAEEDEDGQQLQHQAAQHEGQPHQRLPGPRERQPPLMPSRLDHDIGGRRGWIGARQCLRRRPRRLRHARFQ